MNTWIKDFHTLYFSERKYDEANRIKLEHLPQSLYRYRSTKDIQRIIEQLSGGNLPSIYLSNPAEFNDPYDTRIPVRFENTYLFKKSIGEETVPTIVRYLTTHADIKYAEKLKAELLSKEQIITKKLVKAAKIEDWDKWVDKYIDTLIKNTPSNRHRKLMAVNYFNRVFDRLRDQFSDMFKNNCGIASFTESEKPTSLTMWAHYADNHKGICIEYSTEELLKLSSFDSDVLFPVYYSDDMKDFTAEFLLAGVQYVPDLIDSCNSNDYHPYGDKLIEFGWKNKYIQSFGSQKATAWESEKEWRLIYPLTDTESSEKRLLPVPISAIYLGTDISDENAKMLKEVVDTYSPEISLYKMRMRPERFELEYYPI